jgi:hypothetical protein
MRPSRIATPVKVKPEPPTRRNPIRKPGLTGTRVNIGCRTDFGFNKALTAKLKTDKDAGRLTYFEHRDLSQPFVGDLFLDYTKRPAEDVPVDTSWIRDNVHLGRQTPAELAAGTPFVGVIHLNFLNPRGKYDAHVISYILRKNPEPLAAGHQLILLETFDTDFLIDEGYNLRRGWRNDIKKYFEDNVVSPLTLVAPMVGKDIDLQENDADTGHCAYWAFKMIERAATLDLKTVTPEDIYASMSALKNPVALGGRHRKTRRSKRTKRRGTRHARVR